MISLLIDQWGQRNLNGGQLLRLGDSEYFCRFFSEFQKIYLVYKMALLYTHRHQRRRWRVGERRGVKGNVCTPIIIKSTRKNDTRQHTYTLLFFIQAHRKWETKITDNLIDWLNTTPLCDDDARMRPTIAQTKMSSLNPDETLNPDCAQKRVVPQPT